MSLKIIKSFPWPKGKLVTIKYGGEEHDIVFTYHSIERCFFTTLIANDTIREGVLMKIRYSKDADVCVIQLREGILADSIDLKEGVILHLDSEGNPVEIEILDASRVISFEEMTFSIPSRDFIDTVPAAE